MDSIPHPNTYNEGRSNLEDFNIQLPHNLSLNLILLYFTILNDTHGQHIINNILFMLLMSLGLIFQSFRALTSFEIRKFTMQAQPS